MGQSAAAILDGMRPAVVRRFAAVPEFSSLPPPRAVTMARGAGCSAGERCAALTSGKSVLIDRQVQPERRLMIAVLHDAVSIFLKHGSATTARELRLFADVRDWFAESDGSWPFSFVNICAALEVSPARLRALLQDLRARSERAAIAPWVG